jgi:hypothetical protein
MWKRSTTLCGTVILGAAVAAACSDVKVTGPDAFEPESGSLFRTAPPQAAFEGTIDAAFVRIAGDVPGFGGFYYDEAGALNVVMAAAAQARSPRELAAVLGDHLAALRIPAADVGAMRVRSGEYDFIALDAMHRAVAPVLGMDGVVFTDADEARNRIVVGVENAAAEAAVLQAVAMAGLPAGAVVIERTDPVMPEANHTLRDYQRPVAGGLQIHWDRAGSTFICTLGFNVRAPNRPNVQGFVTNSHCSDTRGVMLETPYWQHSRFIPNTLIGYEAHDIPFIPGGTGDCPVGRNCRWSDALGARYETGVDNAFGAIYRTLFPGPTGLTPGSLEIDPANPRWQITDEFQFPVVGQQLHKTGRTNGWTTGPVNATCQNVNVGGAGNITLFCQDRVSTWSGGGDSGSPYYVRDGETNNVALIGIHWGSDGAGNTVMSAMANIRYENQGPVPWITFPGQTPPPPSGR